MKVIHLLSLQALWLLFINGRLIFVVKLVPSSGVVIVVARQPPRSRTHTYRIVMILPHDHVQKLLLCCREHFSRSCQR